MNLTYIDIVFEGDKFSPRKLGTLTAFKIEVLAEYGEISDKGRYKGKLWPYGLGILKIQLTETEDINKTLKKVVTELLEMKSIIHKCGVDEITLDLENFSQAETEITIDKEIIKLISKLNATIDISMASNFTGSFSLSTKVNSNKKGLLRNTERYFIHQVYDSIITDKNWDHKQSDRLKILFEKKINEDKLIESGISNKVLMSAIIFYILKYQQEENLDIIPSFDEVLKEKYS